MLHCTRICVPAFGLYSCRGWRGGGGGCYPGEVETYSNSFEVEQGLRQGCVLSPLLIKYLLHSRADRYSPKLQRIRSFSPSWCTLSNRRRRWDRSRLSATFLVRCGVCCTWMTHSFAVATGACQDDGSRRTGLPSLRLNLVRQEYREHVHVSTAYTADDDTS